MAQPQTAATQQQVRVVVINGFSDLLPKAYSEDIVRNSLAMIQ